MSAGHLWKRALTAGMLGVALPGGSTLPAPDDAISTPVREPAVASVYGTMIRNVES
jgi:hypothetical protein